MLSTKEDGVEDENDDDDEGLSKGDDECDGSAAVERYWQRTKTAGSRMIRC